MQTFKQKNLLKDLQVSLTELGLYQSKIDGVVGSGSAGAFAKLLGSPIITGGEHADLIASIQVGLKDKGVYTDKVDGLWGKNSQTGFDSVVDCYRKANNIPALSLCWSRRVEPAFVNRINQWVKEKNLDPRSGHWLMAIMCFESSGTFSPSIQNMAGAQAYGLIQFMSAAAQDLGVTLNFLRNLTALQQLEYVFKYFELRMKRWTLRSLEDYYMSVFYPKAIGKSPDDVLFWSDNKATNKAYLQNAGLDINKDKMISVGEISVKIYQTYYDGMLPSNRRTA